MKDPLDLFKDLPDYPGGREPKNRVKRTRAIAEEKYNGAKPKKYTINGEQVLLFTIGDLAKAIGKRPSTLRVWEHRGWLPKAKYRTPKPVNPQIPEKESRGRRLYSLEQVEFLVEAIDQFNVLQVNHGDWNGFRKHIKDNWPQ